MVLRQATVYGYSPRMRFDLAINGMTYGAWKTGVLPLMRDGSQWRPMVHVRDTAARPDLHAHGAAPTRSTARCSTSARPPTTTSSGRSPRSSARCCRKPVKIEWYGDVDHRSYRVSFDKVEALGWKAKYTAHDGALEIYEKLEAGAVDKTTETITLEWYKKLTQWHQIIKEVELHGGIVNINL